MSDNSKIQWTEVTWNFITGCTKVSDGCVNCYIERTPPFRIHGRKFDKPGIGGKTDIILHEDRLMWPLKRWGRKPSRIFVNSLADVFHDDVPTDMIARAFAVMVAVPQHTFQLLTKRHGRMRSLLNSEAFWTEVSAELARLWRTDFVAPLRSIPPWVWVGVSVESQQWAEPRLTALLDVPAQVRWVSAEPLLGPLNLSPWLSGRVRSPIAWLVGGGESGPKARRCDPDWLRVLRDDCASAGVAYFNKQLGTVWAKANGADSHGGDPAFWPVDLAVREYPTRQAEIEDAGRAWFAKASSS